MATRKTAANAAKPTKPAAEPDKPSSEPLAGEPGPQPEVAEGAALLATGGDFTPPPADPEPPAARDAAPLPESLPPDVNADWIARRTEMIAKVCHEANRALCEAFGDHSQVSWEEAADWQRDSAIKGVEFALANPGVTPAEQHAAWCRDKIAAGWGYGPVKDERQKTHDCLVAYELLPPRQQAKDHVFRAIVRAMAG